MAHLNIIVCTDMNGAIGFNNELLAHIPSDLAHFKRITDGKTCVMGRKSFESILKKNGKPLPNRHTIVMSNDNVTKDFERRYDNVTVTSDFKDVFNVSGDVFVCGGESIYKALLPYAKRIYLSRVSTKYLQADTFFPTDLVIVDKATWEMTAYHPRTDELTGYHVDYFTFERRVR